ncbi:MAG: CRISPR-associated endonuclease Cas3'' [Candidatus Nanoarchaeia archaeon]|nr:CRISPR-associated endonuclease Cas3'' [Candidatus Nanoarchaeia archaeon]
MSNDVLCLLAKTDPDMKLIDHLKAVAIISKTMAKSIGLNDILADCAYKAGLLHDIGKAVEYYQKYYRGSKEKYSKEFPMHHEISWAYTANKLNDINILSAIYWTHACPIRIIQRKKLRTYNRDDIIERLSTEEIGSLNTIWDYIENNIINNLSNSAYYTSNIPNLFIEDAGIIGNKNDNAERLVIRTCVLSADRYVSGLKIEDIKNILNGNLNPNKLIESKLLSDISGVPICPKNYESKRFNLQNEVVETLKNSQTTIIKAPAGFGKSIVGLLWNIKRKRKLIWVCPRNEVSISVYNIINKEIKNLGIKCNIELYLTGERKEKNFDDENPGFSSDIVITNLDNLISPMIKNQISDRLFFIMGADIVMDEYHEFVQESPLYAAFITFMRARHRLTTNSYTLLLSATPMNLNKMWDGEKETVVLPNKNDHYEAAHNKNYNINIINEMPNRSIEGSVVIHNSISNAQDEYSLKNYTHLIHHRFTNKDRKERMDAIFQKFGRDNNNIEGTGIQNKENLSSAPVIQASMDLSFKVLYDSICSPESTFQRIGRVNRWGTIEDAYINLVNLELKNNKSEMGAVNCIYSYKLRAMWVDYLYKKINIKKQYTINELYKVYNTFYNDENIQKKITEYLRDQYQKGLVYPTNNIDIGLVSFRPYKMIDDFYNDNITAKTDKKQKLGKSLRNPLPAYYFTVSIKGSNEWLKPEDIMTDGPELRETYLTDGDLNGKLINPSYIKRILEELENSGYDISNYKKKGIPNNLQDWFKLSRYAETPLPDISRIYDPNLGLRKVY